LLISLTYTYKFYDDDYDKSSNDDTSTDDDTATDDDTTLDTDKSSSLEQSERLSVDDDNPFPIGFSGTNILKPYIGLFLFVFVLYFL